MTSTLTLVTLLAYVLMLYGVAWFSARRADNQTFFTGGRRIPWLWVAIGMIGAPMSGVSFVSVPGSVAADGFTYLQMVLGFTVGQVVIAYGLVPLFYRLGVTSLYEYLDTRFGTQSHRIGAMLFLLSKSLLTALKLLVVCVILQNLLFEQLGVPFWGNVALMLLWIWGYTRRGGVKSVVWTDLLQTLFLIGSVVLTIVAIAKALDTPISTLFGDAFRDPRYPVFCWGDPSSSRTFGKMFVGGIFVLIAMTGLDQDMMQRNLSCPSARDSQRNILLTALCQAVVITLLLWLGSLLYRYAAAVQLPASATGDTLFATVAMQGGLPRWVGVLFLLGLLSSSCSTAGSALTALTTSTLFDLLPTQKRAEETQTTRLRHRVHTLLTLLIGLLVLLFHWLNNESVINLLYRVVSYTYGPILGLFAFGLLTRRSIREQGVWGVVLMAPILSALLQGVLLHTANYAIGFELILYNALFTMGGLWILSKRQNKNQ